MKRHYKIILEIDDDHWNFKDPDEVDYFNQCIEGHVFLHSSELGDAIGTVTRIQETSRSYEIFNRSRGNIK